MSKRIISLNEASFNKGHSDEINKINRMFNDGSINCGEYDSKLSNITNTSFYDYGYPDAYSWLVNYECNIARGKKLKKNTRINSYLSLDGGILKLSMGFTENSHMEDFVSDGKLYKTAEEYREQNIFTYGTNGMHEYTDASFTPGEHSKHKHFRAILEVGEGLLIRTNANKAAIDDMVNLFNRAANGVSPWAGLTKCGICNRRLLDKISIRNGIGSTCAKKMNFKRVSS